jgi:hypothetical protein
MADRVGDALMEMIMVGGEAYASFIEGRVVPAIVGIADHAMALKADVIAQVRESLSGEDANMRMWVIGWAMKIEGTTWEYGDAARLDAVYFLDHIDEYIVHVIRDNGCVYSAMANLLRCMTHVKTYHDIERSRNEVQGGYPHLRFSTPAIRIHADEDCVFPDGVGSGSSGLRGKHLQ